MTCTHCGATIAAKALICYRCGNATTAPRVKPPVEGSLFARRRSRLPIALAILAAALIVGGVVDYACDAKLDFNVDAAR